MGWGGKRRGAGRKKLPSKDLKIRGAKRGRIRSRRREETATAAAMRNPTAIIAQQTIGASELKAIIVGRIETLHAQLSTTTRASTRASLDRTLRSWMDLGRKCGLLADPEPPRLLVGEEPAPPTTSMQSLDDAAFDAEFGDDDREDAVN